jgi:hypothetical protein
VKRALIAVIVLLALVAGVLAWLPGRDALLARMGAVSVGVWAVAGLGLLLSYNIRARRLLDEWPGRGLRWRETLHVVLVHNAAVLLLPLRAGEAGYPLLLKQRWGIPVAESAASLVWLRLQDAIVLAALVWVWFGPVFNMPVRAGVAVLGVVALNALAQYWARGHDLTEPSATGVMAKVEKAWRLFVRASTKASKRGWLWSITNWTIKTAALGLLLGAFMGLPFETAMSAASMGEVGGALPFHVPAGLGAYEGAVWLGLRTAGVAIASTQALGAALVVHVYALLLGLAAASCSVALELMLRREPAPKGLG